HSTRGVAPLQGRALPRPTTRWPARGPPPRVCALRSAAGSLRRIVEAIEIGLTAAPRTTSPHPRTNHFAARVFGPPGPSRCYQIGERDPRGAAVPDLTYGGGCRGACRRSTVGRGVATPNARDAQRGGGMLSGCRK